MTEPSTAAIKEMFEKTARFVDGQRPKIGDRIPASVALTIQEIDYHTGVVGLIRAHRLSNPNTAGFDLYV